MVLNPTRCSVRRRRSCQPDLAQNRTPIFVRGNKNTEALTPVIKTIFTREIRGDFDGHSHCRLSCCSDLPFNIAPANCVLDWSAP